MRKNFLAICFLWIASLCACAMGQSRAQHKAGGDNSAQPSFEEFMKGKIDFLVHEMKLSSSDSVKFVEVYQQLMKEKSELMKKHHDAQDSYNRIRKGEGATDADYLKVVMNDVNIQVEDAQLEQRYTERLSKVISARQLFEYRQAERKFKGRFMHRNGNNNRGSHK